MEWSRIGGGEEMKIAVVSTDSVEVDDWFSHATRFLIYELDQEGATFIDERDSEPLPDDFFDAGMMNCVVDIISDCERSEERRVGKECRL